MGAEIVKALRDLQDTPAKKLIWTMTSFEMDLWEMVDRGNYHKDASEAQFDQIIGLSESILVKLRELTNFFIEKKTGGFAPDLDDQSEVSKTPSLN